MRRKLIKSALSLLTVLALVLSVTVAASAAGQPSYSIRLDGKDLGVKTFLRGHGRLYAPYTELFQAFGATAKSDPDNETVSAVKGDLTVEFPLNGYEMTVTEGKNTQTVYVSTGAVKDKSGTIYVPIRYTAQAFGYVVDWDSAANCVVLRTLDSLITESGATYAVMDRYLAAQKGFIEKAHAVNSTFKLNLTLPMDSDSTTKPVPLNASGTVTGVVKQGDSDLQLNMTSNASEFSKSLGSGDEISGQTKFILSLLDSLSLRLITNSQTGMSYIQSPLTATIAGAKSDIWLSQDLSEQTSGLNLTSINTQMLSAASFRDYLTSSLKSINLSENGTSQVGETLQTYNSIFGDKAFVKDGDNEVSTYDTGTGSGDVQIKIKLKLTLKFSGTSFNGTALDVALDMGREGSMTLRTDTDKSNSGSVQLSLDMPKLTAGLTSSIFYSDTASTPAAEPPAGSTVLPSEGLFSSMLPRLR